MRGARPNRSNVPPFLSRRHAQQLRTTLRLGLTTLLLPLASRLAVPHVTPPFPCFACKVLEVRNEPS